MKAIVARNGCLETSILLKKFQLQAKLPFAQELLGIGIRISRISRCGKRGFGIYTPNWGWRNMSI